MTGELREVLDGVLADHGLELYDLEVTGTVVRVTVDRPGGVDLDALAEANKAVSTALDAVDPIEGRYTLEVSSPGIERRLRTPRHFSGAVGETVSVRARRPGGDVERLHGTLTSADDSGFVVEGPEVPDGRAHVGYEDVDRARTVFEWKSTSAPSPSRGRPAGGGPPQGKRASQGKRATSTERVTAP